MTIDYKDGSVNVKMLGASKADLARLVKDGKQIIAVTN